MIKGIEINKAPKIVNNFNGYDDNLISPKGLTILLGDL